VRPGRWFPVGAGPELDDHSATMATSQPGAPWRFRPADSGAALRSIADLDRSALLDGARPDGNGISCRLADPAMLWDQYVLLTRHRWEALFPSGMWSVAAVDLPDWPVAPAAGALLRLAVSKQRRRALEVVCSIDSVAIAKMLFSITTDGPEP